MFRLLFCLVGAAGVGLAAAGWKSIKLRSSGDADRASSCLRRAAWLSAGSAIVLMFLLLGWPWKRQTITTLELIVETVVEPEEVVVDTWRYFHGIPYWPAKEVVTTTTTKEVSKQVPVEHDQRHFSAWLLASELLIAAAAYWAELWVCGLLWRRLPRRFLTDR